MTTTAPAPTTAPTAPTPTSDPSPTTTAGAVVASPAVRVKVVKPPTATPVRIDWAVMAQDKYADVVKLPSIPGCEVVPALTVSRNNWLTYPRLMESAIDRVMPTSAGIRPLIAVDDERKDWRTDSTSTEARELAEMMCELGERAPGCRVMLRGPWQATAQPWMVAEEAKRREHQALNNGLGPWIGSACGGRRGFCGTLYIPDETVRTEWDAFNLDEFDRICAVNHAPPPVVMVSPFYRGEWMKGPVAPVRMLQHLRMVAAAKPQSVAVWGYIGHDRDGGAQAAQAWREVLPGFLMQRQRAVGGGGKATPIKA